MTRKWSPDLFKLTDENRLVPKTDQEFCDFCLAPDPTWEYPAAEMPIVGTDHIARSDDEWGACDECSALIEAKRIGVLVERMVSHHRAAALPAGTRLHPLPVHRRYTRENLLRFFDARTGPRRPYTPTGGTR